jgi:quercetin dioxygenase-like cupin family protein
MDAMDRRSVLGLGFAASTFILPTAASAQTSGAGGQGTQAGVRREVLGEGEARLSGYSKLRMRDTILEPGASAPETAMINDMICHVADGEMVVAHNGMQFTAKKGHVWTCLKGDKEGVRNSGNTVAVMRIIDLLPA